MAKKAVVKRKVSEKRPDVRSLTRSSLPLEDEDFDSEEHRHFPRAKVSVPFHLWIERGSERTFSATLKSSNLSVSGAFLESSFFLPVGTELKLNFEIEEGGDPVLARCQIVRLNHPDPRTGQGRSGMAVRFVEFFEQSEVTLARLFLGEVLQSFAQGYLQSKRAKSMPSELDRVVDALAAWELQKVTQPGDPWRPDSD